MAVDPTTVILPPELLPADGRFGSGPSKVRPEALARARRHRHRPTSAPATAATACGRSSAASATGLADLYTLPDGYEVLLGNGGSTVVLGRRRVRPRRAAQRAPRVRRVLLEVRRRHDAAPFLDDPVVDRGREPGTHPELVADATVDLYAYPHNETSTGVMTDVRRPTATTASSLVDATSGAGGLPRRAQRVRRLLLRAAEVVRRRRRAVARAVLPRRHRAHRAHRRDRPLGPAVARPRRSRSRTPASTRPTTRPRSRRCSSSPTASSGCSSRAASTGAWRAATARPRSSTAGPRRAPSPRRSWPKPSERSHVTAHHRLRRRRRRRPSRQALRANGIVDTEPYRKLGRNQLRIAMFPAIEPDDVATLTHAIDYLVDALR